MGPGGLGLQWPDAGAGPLLPGLSMADGITGAWGEQREWGGGWAVTGSTLASRGRMEAKIGQSSHTGTSGAHPCSASAGGGTCMGSTLVPIVCLISADLEQGAGSR